MKFGGLAEVTSGYFEDHEKVFKSEKKPGEDYPFRVNVKSIVILLPDQCLDVKEIAPTMAFTQRWGANWRLAPSTGSGQGFQGNLHEIPESDYKVLGAMMREGAGA